jgi:hypothetical protein
MDTVQARQSILVPGDTIVSRSEGLFVATVDANDQVRFRKIEVGRDFGAEVEAVSGVTLNDRVIVNPSDEVQEGVTVKVSLRK